MEWYFVILTKNQDDSFKETQHFACTYTVPWKTFQFCISEMSLYNFADSCFIKFFCGPDNKSAVSKLDHFLEVFSNYLSTVLLCMVKNLKGLRIKP